MARIPLNVRVDPELRERLKEQARRENRTLSNLVDTLLREALEQRGGKKTRKR